MPDVLLTFTGFKDPYWDDPVGGGDVEGPILSLLRARRFEHLLAVLCSAFTIGLNWSDGLTVRPSGTALSGLLVPLASEEQCVAQ